MKNVERAFLKAFYEMIKDTYEAKLTEEGLTFLLPDLGLHKSSVKGELMFLDEDLELAGMHSGMLQIYFTVCYYNKEQTEQTAMRLVELNGRVNVGGFELYEPLGHVFYRYCVLLPDLTEQISFELLLAAIEKMTVNLDFLYNYLTIIGQNVNEFTLEEYREQMETIQQALEEDPDFLEKLDAAEDNA